MPWNWELEDWPDLRYRPEAIAAAEATFLRQGGGLAGAYRHLHSDDLNAMRAEVLTSEAVQTSAIEGEFLDRESVRSSILRELGANPNLRYAAPRELGISEMTVDLLRTALEPLTHERLWSWHKSLMMGRGDLASVGAYRTHVEPMRIVSGLIHRPQTHFEAPPSTQVLQEMNSFIEWFNSGKSGMTALARAGIAHLRFESIHPFEDGNGRIGRAISEKALSQAIGESGLTMLATEIEARQKDYYRALEAASQSNEVTDWLQWFAEVVLAAQERTEVWISFLIGKARLLERLRGRFNDRQERALLRMFREGPDGFKGGLSAGKYQKITGASPATAGRDLATLVELGALSRTGEGKGTRYWLTSTL